MKNLLLAFFLLLTTTAYAQKNAAPLPAAPIIYCMLVAEGGHFSGLNLSLDYGQNQGRLSMRDTALANVAQQVARFSSVPAALNYLHSLGWECVQTSTLPYEGSPNYLKGEIGYLLKRHTL